MAKRAQRRVNARNGNRVVEPEPELWSPPERGLCDEHEFYVEPDATNRVTVRRVTYQGAIVDYAVIHSTLGADGAWIEVTCIDCCHQHVHRHTGAHDESDPDVITAIYSQADVQSSFRASYDMVYDAYQKFKGNA